MLLACSTERGSPKLGPVRDSPRTSQRCCCPATVKKLSDQEGRIRSRAVRLSVVCALRHWRPAKLNANEPSAGASASGEFCPLRIDHGDAPHETHDDRGGRKLISGLVLGLWPGKEMTDGPSHP